MVFKSLCLKDLCCTHKASKVKPLGRKNITILTKNTTKPLNLRHNVWLEEWSTGLSSPVN